MCVLDQKVNTVAERAVALDVLLVFFMFLLYEFEGKLVAMCSKQIEAIVIHNDL